MTIETRHRFNAKVQVGDGCWLWLGCTLRNGYGQFFYNGRTETAHRAAVMLDGRHIPEGMQVDHLCSVRACVRPDHLEVVTPRENTLRASKGAAQANARKSECLRGHPLDGDNLIVKARGRNCRACSRIHDRDFKARKRAAL